jgi:hypothetical protein
MDCAGYQDWIIPHLKHPFKGIIKTKTNPRMNNWSGRVCDIYQPLLPEGVTKNGNYLGLLFSLNLMSGRRWTYSI